MKVIDFTHKRLKKKPIVYTVIFTHDSEGFYFEVLDVQDSKKDREAVARDFIYAANSLVDIDYIEQSFNEAMNKTTKEDALVCLWVALTNGSVNDGDMEWAKSITKMD